jgi:hypothetical protein
MRLQRYCAPGKRTGSRAGDGEAAHGHPSSLNHRFPGTYVIPARSAFLLMLGFLAGFVLVFGVGLMLALGGGRAHLPGRLTIAIGALVLIGWLDGQATVMMNRRRPLLAPDPPSYRRFAVWSAVGFFASAALLLGLAWWLP